MEVVKEDAATAIKHAINANTKVINLHEGEADAGVTLGDGGRVVAVRPGTRAAAGGVTGSHLLVKVGRKTVRGNDSVAKLIKQVSARPVQLTFKKPQPDLTLRNLYLLEPGAKILTKAIPADNDYERLAVEKCSLMDDGTRILAKQALAIPAKCRNLRGLYLCANSIGPSGAKSLASALKHLRELRTLRLDSNAVQCEGAKALFTALPETKLERIGLMNNQIADSGCNMLAKVMARCPALTSVNMEANRITDNACRKIMLALPKSSVDHLELSLNRITDRGEKMLQRGRVRQARERKIRKTFDTIDEDGSGELDKQEVAAMAAALGAPLVESLGSIHLSTRKLDEAFAQMDPNGDGTVSFHEFHEWYDKYVDDAPIGPEPEPEPEQEPEQEPQSGPDEGPQDATQALVSRVWEYRRRATLPPSHYSKETARKLRTELMEMKIEALTTRAQSLGVAEYKLEAAAATAASEPSSPRDAKGAIVDLILRRDPFQDNLRGLVALLRDHGQRSRAACRCMRDDMACSLCVNSAMVAEACCWALRLLVTEACASATADDVTIWLRSGALEVLHQAMENHPITVPPDTPHDSLIQQNGCHAVQLVAEKLGLDAQSYACEIGYCESVVAALNGTKLAAIHERAASALRALANDCFVNKFRIGDVGGVEALAHSLRLHSTSPEIVTHTLWSLWHLCRPPDKPNVEGVDAAEHEHLSNSELTMHKQWAASNHRRAVAAKAADAAASAKAKFPWIDSIQDGSIGLLSVIGEVPASASLGRARAVNVAQDHQLAEAVGKSVVDAGQHKVSEPDLSVAAPDPLPTLSATAVSAKLFVADAREAASIDSPQRDDVSNQLKRTQGWGDSPMLLKSAIHAEGCVVALADHENKRDHQETTEMLEIKRLIEADTRKCQAKVDQEKAAWLDRLAELEVVCYLEVRKKQTLLAEAKAKLQADLAEQKQKLLVRYMQRTGVDEDEAEWHDHQVQKIQKATRSRQERKKKQKKTKNQKKTRARPMTKAQKEALKEQKKLLKREQEQILAERVRIAEEEAHAARNRASSRLRQSISKVVAKNQAQRITDDMKTKLAEIAQEQADDALKSMEAKLRDTQQMMTLELGSSQDSFPFEEPHWVEVCPLAPLLPPLQRGDTVKVRTDEAMNDAGSDTDSVLSSSVNNVVIEELEEGTVRKEDRYEPGHYFVKIEGVREPVKKKRNQLLLRLTREQYAEAETKHLQAVALQALKNKQTAEHQYAVELFSQMMDIVIPELTMNAALDSLTTIDGQDGLVVQALDNAEKEAQAEWLTELEAKELQIQQQRTLFMKRRREQMIESYIWREGWENTEANRAQAAQNAAAEKIQKMFQAKRSGVPYGLHNGDGTYKKRKKLVKKTKDKQVLKAEAKLAKVNKAESKLAKEIQEAAEATLQAEQEEREAKQAAEAYEKEQEEARIAREKAAEEEEQARLAAELADKEQEEARVAQERANAELQDVQSAQAALSQAEEALQLAKDCVVGSAEIAELQQTVDAAKAKLVQEQAEYDRALAHADAERREATEAQQVAEKELAEAAAAKERAERETAEAEEARLVKEREEEEARLARERAAKENKDVEAAQKQVERLNREANNARRIVAEHEEEERNMQLAEAQAEAKLLEEKAAVLKAERERLKAEEHAKLEQQRKRRLQREAEQLRDREIRAFREREQEKQRMIQQEKTVNEQSAAMARYRWQQSIRTVTEQRNTRIVLEEAALKGVDLLKQELLAHEDLANPMTEKVYTEIRQKMERWLHENPEFSLTIFDLIAAWVYSMGPGDGAAAEGTDDWPVRHSFKIYDTFNRSMRNVTVPNVADPNFRWLHYHLSNAVHHVPGVEQGQKLYRGQTDLYGDCIDDGKVFKWRDYKSTSTNEGTARDFAGPDGFLFIISDCPHDFGASFSAPEGKQGLTAWPKESEILMPAGVTFRVMKSHTRRNLTIIDLSYVGEWMEDQDAPERDEILTRRKAAEATSRHRKSGLCSWLWSCVFSLRSGNEVQGLYALPPSPQHTPKSPLDDDASDNAPRVAPRTPTTPCTPPPLPGMVAESPHTIQPVSRKCSPKVTSRFADIAIMVMAQKSLRSELVTTHQMPEKVFSAILQKMKDWAKLNPSEPISYKLEDLVAAWVYGMGRPAEPDQIILARMTHQDYNIQPWGVVADIEVRNSFRISNTFNESMRSTEVARHAEPEYKWMHYHLTNAVSYVKGASMGQLLYRGQPELYGESYYEGCIVQWKDFKSTSTDRQVASDLAGKTGFVFAIVEGVSENLGANFNTTNPPLAAWPEPSEILLPAGATFRVLKRYPLVQTSSSTSAHEPSRGSEQTLIDLKYLGEWVDPRFKDSAELGEHKVGYRNITIVGAAGLASADMFKKSDPYAVVEVLDHQPGQEDEDDWIRIGQTEHIYNSLDPVWQIRNVFCEEILHFYVGGELQPPERQMKVRVRIYDFDNTEDETDDDFLGQATFETEGAHVLFAQQSLALEGSEEYPFAKVQGEVIVEVSDAIEPEHKSDSAQREREREREHEPEPERPLETQMDQQTLRERLQSQAYPTQSEIASFAEPGQGERRRNEPK